MAFLQNFLLVVSLTLVAADDGCPAAAEISPCTCDVEGLNCMGTRTIEEIRKAFRARFKFGGVPTVWIQGTPIKIIPGDLFGNVKSKEFHIQENNITSLDFNAFSASKKTLQNLNLFGNKLANLDYSGLTQYEALTVLDLRNNKITSIPDGAFQSESLTEIRLSENDIFHIGKNAFSGVPKLKVLEVIANRLQTLGPMSFASKVHSTDLEIDLSFNRISNISSTAFQDTAPKGLNLNRNRLTYLPYDTFARLITRIARKGGFIDVSDNRFLCKGCKNVWLVLNKDILSPRLKGFKCTDGRSLQDLERGNIQCNY